MSKRQRRRAEKRRGQQRNRERPLGHSLMAGAGVTAGATMLIGGVAQAATLTVGTTADPGTATDCTDAANTDCTLRQAIADANSDPLDDHVSLGVERNDHARLGPSGNQQADDDHRPGGRPDRRERG